MESTSDNWYIRIATEDDKPSLKKFLQSYYFMENPFSEAMLRLGGGFSEEPVIHDSFMNNIDEELSVVAFLPEDGSVIGLIHNAQLKIITGENIDYSKNNFNSDTKQLMNLIRHVETQIDLLEDGEKEMEVVSITMHPDWKFKELGKCLLEETINVAKEKNFKQIRAICTSAYSSQIFNTCGFECVYSVNYEEFKKVGRINVLPNPPHTHMKAMVLTL